VQGSTRRLAQLTGDYDPEGLPHLNATGAWGIDGADLGANTEHEGRLYIFFGDVPQRHLPATVDRPPHDADSIASIDLGPLSKAAGDRTGLDLEGGKLHLTLVRDGARFHPFTEEAGVLGTNETPTGAFSHAGRVYVFVVKGGAKPYSVLTSSEDPTKPKPFRRHFVWSDASAESGRFWQVAPWVVRLEEVPGLSRAEGVSGRETEGKAEGKADREGVILLGHGRSRSGFGVHLACLPLRSDRGPEKEDVRYWTRDAAHRWSTREADAEMLFPTRFAWTSLSVGRIPSTGQWILLYQRTSANEAPDEAIVARVSETPWGLARALEIAVFDPVRDGALGRYMFRPGLPDPNGLRDRAPRIGHPSFAYGAFLLNPFTRWDPAEKTVTVYFLLSTGWPYQVQLMRSRLAFETAFEE
jgi:hypothetical protein